MRKRFSWNKRKKGKAAMQEELKDQQNNAEEQAVDQTEQETQDESETVEAQVEGADNQAEMEVADLDDAIRIIGELQLDLREKEAALTEAKDHNARLQADFINLRNRTRKEVAETIRFANQDLLVSLLPILDNFDRTLSAIEKTDNMTAVKEGIDLVNNNMRRQFTKLGLEPIESFGKEFDSELHEAITAVPVEDEAQKGKVIDEVEKGYKLKDKVIRFAKVVVGE
ncbi:MAG: nucleotide exchange factor GrpE [Bacteroidota bacterium]